MNMIYMRTFVSHFSWLSEDIAAHQTRSIAVLRRGLNNIPAGASSTETCRYVPHSLNELYRRPDAFIFRRLADMTHFSVKIDLVRKLPPKTTVRHGNKNV